MISDLTPKPKCNQLGHLERIVNAKNNLVFFFTLQPSGCVEREIHGHRTRFPRRFLLKTLTLACAAARKMRLFWQSMAVATPSCILFPASRPDFVIQYAYRF